MNANHQQRYELPTFLPGKLILAPGTARDYDELARFHYIAARPATFAQIWTIRHIQPQISNLKSEISNLKSQIPNATDYGRLTTDSLCAIAILSHPTLNLRIREKVLNLEALSIDHRHRFVNHNIRTISRVIVHPVYRSLGLAVTLIQWILHNSPTRYTEALAHMARAHPMFKRAGMAEYPAESDDKPLYYLFDRTAQGGGIAARIASNCGISSAICTEAIR